MGDGIFTVVKIYCPFNDSAGFSGKRSSDRSGFWRNLPPCDRKIFPVYLTVAVHIGKDAAADKMFGNYCSPEVSRSKRLQHRKINGFFCL